MKTITVLCSLAAFLFGVTLAAQTITVTKPRANKILKYGTTCVIKWTKTGNLANSVSIGLRRPNSQSYRAITASTANTGSYNWKVDARDGKYIIQVSVRADAAHPDYARGDSAVFHVKGLNPDLAINWLKVEPKKRITVAKQITFTASIYNAGILKAKATQAELEIRGPIKRKILIPFGELGGHKTNTIVYKYSLPQYGIYRNILKLDAKRQLQSRNPQMAGEKNTANNTKAIVYGVNPLSDLVIIAKKYQHVKVPGKSTITVKVKNIGDTPAPKSKLKFWIQKKGTKHYQIPVLKPGKIHVVKRKERWIMPGKRKFAVEIDPSNKVPEKKENNNKFAGEIQKGGKYGLQNEEISSDDGT